MDVVIICNGLGNQMSQYAFYLQKKKIDKSTRFIFDRRSLSTHNGYELENVFNIKYKEEFVDKLLFSLFRFLMIKRAQFISLPIIKFLGVLGIKLINENPNYDHDPSLFKPTWGINFYYGGWHSEKNFIDVKAEISDVFQFKINSDHKLTNVLNDIKAADSVSIHVRRGDFLNAENINTFGSVCSKEYFEAAIEKINLLVKNPYFFVFTNDVEWVRSNLIHENLKIIDFNKKNESWKDMFLMSNCKHNINSNSTFSWWGSWLNKNKSQIVIVPKYFINNVITKDFYPETWIKLSNY